MFVELSGLRWIKCWVKRTLKWRPVVFAVITSLFSAFDCVRFGHVELGTVVGSAVFSVVGLYFIGVFWVFGLIAMACAEALKRALRWCARNRTGARDDPLELLEALYVVKQRVERWLGKPMSFMEFMDKLCLPQDS